MKYSALQEFDKEKVRETISPLSSYEHSTHILERNIHKFIVAYIQSDTDILAYVIVSTSGQIKELGYTDIHCLKQRVQVLMVEYKTVTAKNIDM